MRIERVALNWKPHPKGRPRVNRKTGSMYTPTATKNAEKALREQWPEDIEPFDGPISVILNITDTDVDVFISERRPPNSKGMRGDADNYAKTILDGLNGVAWKDDKQIKHLTVEIL